MELPDLSSYTNILIIIGLVAAAVVLGIVLFKLLRSGVRGRKGSRIGISEYHELDKTRRLVLVRRDDVEHLILIGGGEDLVVESGIGSPLTHVQPAIVAASPTMQMPAQSSPQAFRPPRPPVFASRRPELRTVNTDDDAS